ncbi:integrase, catalytic region, zinc finger, CCHC-type containing protein, partial [Tanacetum coccineum]
SLQYGSPFQSQRYSINPSSTPLSITHPSNDYQSSSVHHNVYSSSSSIPQLEYAPSVNQQPEFSQPDLSLIVPVFKQRDDPIDAINYMMSFLSAVVTSRYPTTNNQLRNSSNPRTYTPTASGSNSGKQRTIICYNCKGEGHMSKQCTKPKRKQDDSWFKDKVLLGSDAHAEYVKESQHTAVQNSNSSAQQDALILSVIEQLKTQIHVNSEIDRLKQTLSEHLKEKESLMQAVTLLKMILRKKNLETLIEKLL